MGASMEKLVSYLPEDNFKILDKVYPNYSKEEQNLIPPTGYHRYSYFDNIEKFQVEKLPPREQWKNSLRNGEIMITENQWQHAENVHEQFQCANLGD